MKIKNIFQLSILKYIMPATVLFIGCEGMIKELDIDFLAFPPKLSITALLDKSGFDITIMEGRSLAEFPFPQEKENIRNGEIRLYEDGKLIRTLSGPFDMSENVEESGNLWSWGKNGYRYISLNNSFTGSVYGLEVELEGYPMVSSTSVMPEAPVVSATMDTSVQVIYKHVAEIPIMGYRLWHLGNSSFASNPPDKYWSVSVNIVDPCKPYYYVLDVVHWLEFSDHTIRFSNWGIGALDVSILLREGMDVPLMTMEKPDIYMFSMLMSTDFTFVRDSEAQTFYIAVPEIPNQQNVDDSYFENNSEYEKITIVHSLHLRVRQISPEIYRYYRSLSLQLVDRGMFSNQEHQPVAIAGNVENGYGSFSVYNATSIKLFEWETYEYREKEE